MLLKARDLEHREQADLQGQREKTVLWRFSLTEPSWCLCVPIAGGKRRCCGEVIDPALRFLYQMESLCHTFKFHPPSWQCRFIHIMHTVCDVYRETWP